MISSYCSGDVLSTSTPGIIEQTPGYFDKKTAHHHLSSVIGAQFGVTPMFLA